jgi:hypothetical protein
MGNSATCNSHDGRWSDFQTFSESIPTLSAKLLKALAFGGLRRMTGEASGIISSHRREWDMGTTGAKQIVYRYNGDEKSEEVEQDLDGELAFQEDQVILRKGKNWRIVHLGYEVSLSGQGPIPVVRVFLSDQHG